MQSEKANEDTLESELDTKNPLIEWYMNRFHRLVQREHCGVVIRTTRLVHHMFIGRWRDLVQRRLTIIYPPHRPDHRTIADVRWITSSGLSSSPTVV